MPAAVTFCFSFSFAAELSSGTITVSSTTDSQEQVDSASVPYADTEMVPENEGLITPITTSEDGRIATTTDSAETVRQVAEDMEADRQERPDYLGRSGTLRRINELVRPTGGSAFRSRSASPTTGEQAAAARGGLAGIGTATGAAVNSGAAATQRPKSTS